MAWARKLANPTRWQGVATHPSGRKSTKVFRLKGQAQGWAAEQEATWRRDDRHDPRAGQIKVAEWVEMWSSARVVERPTRAKNASQLRTHILPKWGSWPLNSIDRLDVGAWVQEMDRAGRGPATIEGAVRLFSGILHAAMEVGRIASNPCARQRVPKAATGNPRYFTRDEAAAIIAAMPEPWDFACNLDMHTGLRLGELLGLKVTAVDWERGDIRVSGVMTRYGWRPYGKSKRSHRVVPVPGSLMDTLAPYVLGREPEALLFTAPLGGPMSDVNFRNRVWFPAVARAGVERQTPHTMRHTAASWLVQDGVDLYRVQALLGHESFATTQRYAHLAPSAHEAIRAAWENLGARTVHAHGEGPAPGGGQGL